eukprot:15346722-Alexandrium_andersonii.AAC.1
MSASLVGSEMCIRDRCTATLRGVAAQHARGGRCLLAPLVRKLERGRAIYDLAKDHAPNEPEIQKLAIEAASKAD